MTLQELVKEVCAKHDVRVTAMRGTIRLEAVVSARREVWERGNLAGFTDAELARATGVTRQSVADWLDTPRRRQ